jgi:hypothetical protein
VLFAARFTKLADDQFLTALAWGLAALRDANDPQARAKQQSCSPRQTQDGTLLSIRVLENHVFLGTRLDRKISARDVLNRRVLPAHLFREG